MKSPITRRIRLATVVLLVAVQGFYPSTAGAWGLDGHLMAGRAAALRCPKEMPEFFLKAADQLAYLNPEPDRWRDRQERDADPAMSNATSPEHYIDMELAPDSALAAKDRFAFADELKKAGNDISKVGTSPFTILEHFQKLRVEFRLWRAEPDGPKKRFIEQRIINDAGIMGHYVTDGSNPHHTTIHHNGWATENDKGYTLERSFHGRFESQYVRAKIKPDEVLALVSPDAKLLANPKADIIAYLKTSHGKVEALYELEKKGKFDEDQTSQAHKDFTLERLAAGSTMLRDLWWTAWVTSGVEAPTRDGR